MRGNLLHRFPVVVVHLEFLLFVDGVRRFLADDDAFFKHGVTQQFANVRVVADGFGNDVACPFECIFHVRDTFLGVDKRSGECFERCTRCLLIPEIVSERFQTLFPCDHRLGTALGFVWEVKIFQLALIQCSIDARLQVVGQLALFLNGSEDGLFAGHQLAEIEKFFFDGADLDLVEVTG